MVDDKHEKAIDMTEKALDALEDGDDEQAKTLIDKAKKLDPSAVDEVVQDLEDSAGSSVPVAEE